MAKKRSASELAKTMESTLGLEKGTGKKVLEFIQSQAIVDLRSSDYGAFELPGMIKVTTRFVDATPATTKKNPFKPGETINVPAKPPSTKIQVRVLKPFKEGL